MPELHRSETSSREFTAEDAEVTEILFYLSRASAVEI